MNNSHFATKKGPTPDQLIFGLIRTFPCLEIKVGPWLHRTERFDPDEFFSLFDCASSGERLCALFVLNVWSHGYAETKGWRFDFIAFMSCADSGNRNALLAWATKPFWP
jgi:hypothetical protein